MSLRLIIFKINVFLHLSVVRMASDQEAKAQLQIKRDPRDQKAEAKREKSLPALPVTEEADLGKSVTDMRVESKDFFAVKSKLPCKN
jgi:hypothetical protein